MVGLELVVLGLEPQQLVEDQEAERVLEALVIVVAQELQDKVMQAVQTMALQLMLLVVEVVLEPLAVLEELKTLELVV